MLKVHYRNGDTETCEELIVNEQNTAFELVVHNVQVMRVSEFGTIARIEEVEE